MSELREKERSMEYVPVVFYPLLFPHGFLDGLWFICLTGCNIFCLYILEPVGRRICLIRAMIGLRWYYGRLQ